jgi:hypothetical protein
MNEKQLFDKLKEFYMPDLIKVIWCLRILRLFFKR